MTRDEHLKWCRERAIVEMDFYKNPKKALVSMMSDLRKHPETNDEILIMLCGAHLMKSMNRQEMIDFIDGFH